MKKAIKTIDYQFSIELLESEINKTRKVLKEEKNESIELIGRIKNLERAVRWLKKGEEFNISPEKKVLRLPDSEVKTPSSEFRIIEDFESDDSKDWKEIQFKQKFIRPLPGSWLILE